MIDENKLKTNLHNGGYINAYGVLRCNVNELNRLISEAKIRPREAEWVKAEDNDDD